MSSIFLLFYQKFGILWTFVPRRFVPCKNPPPNPRKPHKPIQNPYPTPHLSRVPLGNPPKPLSALFPTPPTPPIFNAGRFIPVKTPPENLINPKNPSKPLPTPPHLPRVPLGNPSKPPYPPHPRPPTPPPLRYYFFRCLPNILIIFPCYAHILNSYIVYLLQALLSILSTASTQLSNFYVSATC